MRVTTARFTLFAVWCSLFLVYVVTFLLTSEKDNVDFDQASEAAWKIAYVFLPILTAFSVFWFTPTPTPKTAKERKQKEDEEQRTIDRSRAIALFALTAVFHVIVMVYFLIAVVLVDWGWHTDDPKSYTARVDGGIKLLTLLSVLAVMPVGYVLGGKPPVLRAPQ
jgi:hypothetical protein